MSDDEIKVIDEFHVWQPGWEEKVGKVLRQAARAGTLPVDPDKIYPREEWRDHIPSGYEDMSGYGQVSCSCGWSSGDKLDWEEHIDAAARAVDTLDEAVKR